LSGGNFLSSIFLKKKFPVVIKISRRIRLKTRRLRTFHSSSLKRKDAAHALATSLPDQWAAHEPACAAPRHELRRIARGN
jgi:hypothetical protein